MVALSPQIDAATDSPTDNASEQRRPGHQAVSGEPHNCLSPDLAHRERGVDQ